MMRLGKQVWAVAVLGFMVVAQAALGQSVQVTNLDGKTTTVTAEQIAALPHVSVSVKDHEKPAQFDGVPLAAVLKAAGAVSEVKMKSPRLTQVLLIEATDGYKVVFAMAEVDPDFSGREILLADKLDGKALDDKRGPFQIVSPGDKRAARWIRQVKEIKVVQVK